MRRAVLRRFDVLTEAAGLDRERARCWTPARVLREALWSTRSGRTWLDPVPAAIATTLLTRNG